MKLTIVFVASSRGMFTMGLATFSDIISTALFIDVSSSLKFSVTLSRGIFIIGSATSFTTLSRILLTDVSRFL